MTIEDDRLERQRQRLEGLVTDLAVSYDPRRARDREIGEKPWAGLYEQLTHSLGQGSTNDPGDEGRSGKPGPRSPGWRSDVSALINTIDDESRNWDVGGRSTLERLRNLPYVVKDEDIPARADELAGWVARATIQLGYRAPAQDLPGVRCEKRHLTRSGWQTTGCGQTSLKHRPGGSTVWCSTSLCHDSVIYPDCEQDAEGAWSCRDSDGDRTHVVTFSKDEWLALWAEMQVSA